MSETGARKAVHIVVRVVVGLVITITLFFLPAGKLDWLDAWLFLAFFLGFTLTLYIWMSRHDPGLVAERQQAGPNVERWDKAIMRAYSVVLLGLPIVAGLDERWGWCRAPWAVHVLGWVGLGVAAAVIWWSMASNSFLSEQVRIQEERGHRVVADGPYRYVRHPMYVGVIACFLGERVRYRLIPGVW